METEEYYKQAEFNRVNKISKDLNNSREPELLKEFTGKEDFYEYNLIKRIIDLKELKKDKINELIESQKLFISVRNYDLLKEFILLDKKTVEQLDKNWLIEFRILARKFLFEIYLKNKKDKIEKSMINQRYQILIEKCEYLNTQL